MFQAQKKSIRRATVNTFGYIAKAIGPQDVIHTLLNNLKVQDRTNRVCTTVAIAIVAETCQPFTVLPALMNEYRIPDVNVQHGVLKVRGWQRWRQCEPVPQWCCGVLALLCQALSFTFEYIGEMGKDYIYAVVPLLEDALMERDMIHRQTACACVKRTHLLLQPPSTMAMSHLLLPSFCFTLPIAPYLPPTATSDAYYDLRCCRRCPWSPSARL